MSVAKIYRGGVKENVKGGKNQKIIVN